MAKQHVLLAVAAAAGLQSPAGNWSPATLVWLSKAANDFEEAVKPGSVDALRAKPGELGARAKAFMVLRNSPREVVREVALGCFDFLAPLPADSPAGETPAQRRKRERTAQRHEAEQQGKFDGLASGAIDRFRTYDGGMLAKVVGYFRDWGPTVEWLQGLRPGDIEKEPWWLEFRKGVIGYLVRTLGVPEPVAEDAFQHASLSEISAMNRGLGDPGAARYVFEGPLDGWIKNAAYYRCLAMRHDARQGQQPGAAGIVRAVRVAAPPLDLPDPDEVVDAFALVRSTFNNPDDAGAAWAQIAEDVFGLPADPTGRRPTALTKFALLSRLLAVLHVREKPAVSDEDLIEYLRSHKRYRENDRGTLLKLAALVRAAQAESLQFPALAHYLVDRRLAVDDALRFLPGLSRLPSGDDRIIAARTYHYDSADRVAAWNQFRNAGVGRWIAACWYLECWRTQDTVESAAESLFINPRDEQFLGVYNSVAAPLIRAVNGFPMVLAAATLDVLGNGGKIHLTLSKYPRLRELPQGCEFAEACRDYDFATHNAGRHWDSMSGTDREKLAAGVFRTIFRQEIFPPTDGSLSGGWKQVVTG